MAALMLATVGVMLPDIAAGKIGIIFTKTLTTGAQFVFVFAHAVSEYVLDVGGATVIDFVF